MKHESVKDNGARFITGSFVFRSNQRPDVLSHHIGM